MPAGGSSGGTAIGRGGGERGPSKVRRRAKGCQGEPMYGVIFDFLRSYVIERHGGRATWDALLKEAGIGYKVYFPVAQYPDEEIVKLATTAAADQAGQRRGGGDQSAGDRVPLVRLLDDSADEVIAQRLHRRLPRTAAGLTDPVLVPMPDCVLCEIIRAVS